MNTKCLFSLALLLLSLFVPAGAHADDPQPLFSAEDFAQLELTTSLGNELTALKDTKNFAQVCTAVAEGVVNALQKTTDENPETLKKHTKEELAIALGDVEPTDQKSWMTGLNAIFMQLTDQLDGKPFAEWRTKFATGIKALRLAAQTTENEATLAAEGGAPPAGTGNENVETAQTTENETADQPEGGVGEIGDSQAFLDSIKEGLGKLSDTPNFRGVCNAIAFAIDDSIDPTDTDPDPSVLITVATSSVASTINREISSDEPELRQKWKDGYDQLIRKLRDGEVAGLKPKTSKQWIALYQLAITVLRTARGPAEEAVISRPDAEQEVAPAGTGINASKAFASENVIEQIVEGINTFKLTKDTSFQRNTRAIIDELEKLRDEVKDTLDTMAGEAYMTKLRAAFQAGISDPRMGSIIRKRWVDAYNEFENKVSAKDKDDPKTWDHATVLLITALKKAILIDTSWQEEAKNATPTGSGSIAAQGSGTVSGIGITPHAARKIRWISSRAAVHRARTQAILGR